MSSHLTVKVETDSVEEAWTQGALCSPEERALRMPGEEGR